ncbi:MAG: hypothetical protein OXF74_07375 [Rhodobacteraceae bacterium]|nr:hypothetical protein [Paracoccaceae bacterium]
MNRRNHPLKANHDSKDSECRILIGSLNILRFALLKALELSVKLAQSDARTEPQTEGRDSWRKY